MLNAKRQAEEYARALPTSHGWPPFILVCDVGHCIEVYADFSGQGKNYTQFPDRQTFRIYLEDLRNEDVRERLRKIWLDPASLDPAQASAKVTRDIAKRLAQVSLALEKKNYPAQDVAMFLMRCLFTMFAEDVGLLPEKSFKEVLEECEKNPEAFTPRCRPTLGGDGHRQMGACAENQGEEIQRRVLQKPRGAAARPRGNRRIAAGRQLHLERGRSVDLRHAARTGARSGRARAARRALHAARLCRAAGGSDRHRTACARTGATCRPRRRTKRASGDLKGAAAEVQAFHDKLCETRVLDPACGTGNFLYVSLELMKRLEGEVLEALLDLGGQEALRGLGSHSVDPHQFLGLEINPRAAAIAELVLWIGYLQWHFRTKGAAAGRADPARVQEYSGQERGADVGRRSDPEDRRWQGNLSERATAGMAGGGVHRRQSAFIGGKRILRSASGDAFTEALWAAHSHVNESADFVMYWWDRAAELLTTKGTDAATFRTHHDQFDLAGVSTQSDGAASQGEEDRYHLVMAIPDHPWTKATDDAGGRSYCHDCDRAEARSIGTACSRSYVGKKSQLNTDATVKNSEETWHDYC